MIVCILITVQWNPIVDLIASMTSPYDRDRFVGALIVAAAATVRSADFDLFALDGDGGLTGILPPGFVPGRTAATVCRGGLEDAAAAFRARKGRDLKDDEFFGLFSRSPGSVVVPITAPDGENLLLCVVAQDMRDEDLAAFLGVARICLHLYSIFRERDHDRLTGLKNRSQLEEQVSQRLWNRAENCAQPASGERRCQAEAGANWLAILDLDHFKRINDTFGHLYGDEVLILLAGIMRQVFRRADQLYRYGGEEFIVLLPRIDRDGAMCALERFRAAVETHDFPQVGRVTVSLGAVEVAGQPLATTVIGHADQALYWVKSHGRNQVALYEDLLADGRLTDEVRGGSLEIF